MSESQRISPFAAREGETDTPTFFQSVLELIQSVADYRDFKNLDARGDALVAAARLLLENGLDVADADLPDDAREILDAAITAFAEASGESRERLDAALDRLRQGLTEQLPEDLRPLFRRLDAQRNKLAWPLEWMSGGPALFSEGFPIDLSARAGLSFELTAVSAADSDLPVDDPDGQYLLGIGASGEVGAEAAGEVFVNPLSIGGEGSASGAVAIRYQYLRAADEYLIEALVPSLLHLPSPFDVHDLGASWEHDLRRVTLTTSGSIGFGVEASVGKGFTASLDDDAGALGGLGFEAEAAIKASVRIQRKGHFKLKATPMSGKRVRVALDTGSTEVDRGGVGLSAGVRLTGVDQTLKPLLERVMPEIEPLREKLGDLKDPGTWIRSRIDAAIPADSPIVTDLVDALFADEQTVRAELLDTIEDAANRGVMQLSSGVDRATDTLVGELRTRLPVPRALRERVANELRDAIKAELGELRGKLEDKIDNALGRRAQAQNTPGILQVLEPFLEVIEDMEEGIDRWIEEVDDAAARLKGRLLKVFDRYQALRADILEEVAALQESGVQLDLGFRGGRSETETGLLRVEVRTDAEAGRRAHRAMLHGDFSRAIELAKRYKDEAGANPPVKLREGRFSREIQSERVGFISLRFDDLSIQAATFIQQRIEVERNASGELLAFTGKLTAGGQAKFLDQQMRFEVANSLALAARAEESGKRLVANLGVDLTFFDEDLEPEELADYLDSARIHGLLGDAEMQRLMQAYRRIAGEAGAVEASVQLTMRYPPRFFERLRRKLDASGGRNGDPHPLRRVIVDTLLDMAALKYAPGVYKLAVAAGSRASAADNFAALMASGDSGRDLQDKIESRARANNWNYRRASTSGGPTKSPFARAIRELANVVSIAADLEKGFGALDELAALDPTNSNLTDRVKDLQDDAGEGFAALSRVGAVRLGWSDKLQPFNIALLKIIADIGAQETPLTGVVRERRPGGRSVDEWIEGTKVAET